MKQQCDACKKYFEKEDLYTHECKPVKTTSIRAQRPWTFSTDPRHWMEPLKAFHAPPPKKHHATKRGSADIIEREEERQEELYPCERNDKLNTPEDCKTLKLTGDTALYHASVQGRKEEGYVGTLCADRFGMMTLEAKGSRCKNGTRYAYLHAKRSSNIDFKDVQEAYEDGMPNVCAMDVNNRERIACVLNVKSVNVEEEAQRRTELRTRHQTDSEGRATMIPVLMKEEVPEYNLRTLRDCYGIRTCRL